MQKQETELQKIDRIATDISKVTLKVMFFPLLLMLKAIQVCFTLFFIGLYYGTKNQGRKKK